MTTTAKTITIMLLAATMTACSAQKRLTALLKKHPELQKKETVYIHDTIIINNSTIIQPDTARKQTSIQEIEQNDTIETENEKSKARLIKTKDGTIELQAITKPDTIKIHDTLYVDKKIEVPSYLTHTEYTEKEVYKMKWWQTLLFDLGIISAIYLLMKTIFKIIITYVKPI